MRVWTATAREGYCRGGGAELLPQKLTEEFCCKSYVYLLCSSLRRFRISFRVLADHEVSPFSPARAESSENNTKSLHLLCHCDLCCTSHLCLHCSSPSKFRNLHLQRSALSSRQGCPAPFLFSITIYSLLFFRPRFCWTSRSMFLEVLV